MVLKTRGCSWISRRSLSSVVLLYASAESGLWPHYLSCRVSTEHCTAVPVLPWSALCNQTSRCTDSPVMWTVDLARKVESAYMLRFSCSLMSRPLHDNFYNIFGNVKLLFRPDVSKFNLTNRFAIIIIFLHMERGINKNYELLLSMYGTVTYIISRYRASL